MENKYGLPVPTKYMRRSSVRWTSNPKVAASKSTQPIIYITLSIYMYNNTKLYKIIYIYINFVHWYLFFPWRDI